MKKKVFILLILLALVGIYAMTATAKDNGDVPDPATATAPIEPRSPTATADTCKVYTGIDGGTVNLRECEGPACGSVLDILTEGESLTIITAGEYVNVTTKSGVTGWLNSKYCKEEK